MSNETQQNMSTLEAKGIIYERALFGFWDGTIRSKGLIEKFEDNDRNFRTLHSQVGQHRKLLRGLYVLILLPFLASAGIPTKDILPFVMKVVIHALTSL